MRRDITVSYHTSMSSILPVKEHIVLITMDMSWDLTKKTVLPKAFWQFLGA